ncbi:3-keto-disaccharide hydrolase [Horticoccus sp. 23ND18S-11]|uniref:3-keto-disaccharide hydrolase n=1 Tax=Horticoccus sp. 23ND18S-11 TaxID=3391832 RepID=UPI0039C9326E
MKTSAFLLLALAAAVMARADEKDGKPFPLGYTDTPPIFPGSPWKVHDLDRPRPVAVTPGAKSGAAPADAIVLFDGKSTAAFVGKDGVPCKWKIENGELIVDGGDVWSKESFASCQFHIEWKSDPKTYGNSQKKGNAGVFFMDRYEIQILDCTNNPTYADGMSGAIYGQTPPLVNAVRPAGEWQTYDILFTAPRLEAGKVVEPAYVTVIVNGIVVQNHTKILGPTLHKKATSYDGKFPDKAPFRFQDHKNTIPDRFRNIWVRPL